MLPFPQVVEQAPRLARALRQVGSLVQVFEQPVPSPLKRPFGPVQPRRELGRVGAAVAGFARLDHAVTADRDGALSAGGFLLFSGSSAPGSDLTGARAAVAVVGVAVVARLAASDDAVAAERDAGLARHRATPAGVDRRAVARAAVVPFLFPSSHASGAVSFPSPQTALRLQGWPDVGTDPAVLNLAERRATVAAHLVAVVALLTVVELAVAARRADRRRQIDAASVGVRAVAAAAVAAAFAGAAAAAAGAGAFLWLDARATGDNEPKNDRRNT